jgi:peptidoglycan/LPS O-acetylase OafA/YrhL
MRLRILLLHQLGVRFWPASVSEIVAHTWSLSIEETILLVLGVTITRSLKGC